VNDSNGSNHTSMTKISYRECDSNIIKGVRQQKCHLMSCCVGVEQITVVQKHILRVYLVINVSVYRLVILHGIM